MPKEQNLSNEGPIEITVVLNDLEAWHTRAITRMFYPNTAASVSISMPDTIAAFQKTVLEMRILPPDQSEKMQKAILILRDAIAALVAQGISGKAPEYSGFTQFQKQYDELMQILRRVVSAKRIDAEEEKKFASVRMSPATPLKGIIQPTESNPMTAFSSVHNHLSDDTPLKRYVRGMKPNRNGQKG